MKIIKLKNTDYWDEESSNFVVYMHGEQDIPTDVSIEDNEIDWYCYLYSAKWDSATQSYICLYKKL